MRATGRSARRFPVTVEGGTATQARQVAAAAQAEIEELERDGRDDERRRVPEGRYVLHVEAAREHGERELVKLPFSLAGEAFELQANGDRELGSIGIEFGPRP